MKYLGAEKGKKPESFKLNHMRFYKKTKENYRSLLKFYSRFGNMKEIKVTNIKDENGDYKYSWLEYNKKNGRYIVHKTKEVIMFKRVSEWFKRRMIKRAIIQYDETVNSIVTINSRSKRAGKFDQHTYLVCFNIELGYGYMYNTKKHFQKTNRKDLKDFMKRVQLQDHNFRQWWIKDARTWGSSAHVKGMLETDNKKYTMDIERRFGWVKNEVYRNMKEVELTQYTLERLYKKAFAKYHIIEIID